MTEHKDKPHEALAELLGRIGWVCRGDAQWTRLEAAMPEIAALVANPVQQHIDGSYCPQCMTIRPFHAPYCPMSATQQAGPSSEQQKAGGAE